ncbi:MAG: hypothetical protein GTO22_03300 [Gemmatimonadales bacterium]|nr:hypothetical protein [Gemmatimonadales bacterium]
MSENTEQGSRALGMAGGMVVSGVIAALIAGVVVYVLSFLLAFPWSLGQTLIAVAIGSFCGSAVSFVQGHRLGRRRHD